VSDSLDLRSQPQLARYVECLLGEGDRLGLTAFREAEPIWNELIADSASAAARLPQGGKVVDLGSGGGCPGVVLQLLRPDVRVDLLESNGRKAGFLRQVVELLGLPGQVLQDRSETLARHPAYRGSYDMVVAKAVASLPTLVELALPLLRVGGVLLAYKGPSALQELEDCQVALQALRGKLRGVEPYTLGQKEFCHVLIEKVDETPKAFPRRPGIPAKQPLR